MRVLQLPIVICSQGWELTHALRVAGIQSDYMILDDDGYDWILPGKPDYNLRINQSKNQSFKKNIARIGLFFAQAALKYDVFHYHSNIPLFYNYFDVKLLKRLGKKIVVSYWGCDVRLKSVNSNYKYNTCDSCRLICDEKAKKERLKEFSKYADLKLISMPEIIEYVPGSVYFPPLIDEDFWAPQKKSRSTTFTIFHPVGNSQQRGDVKGSKSILRAIERLKQDGIGVSLLSADQIPNRKLKEFYARADLVVEQLRSGWHGVTALEAMSMGKPVITYIRPDLKKYEPELPIINANPENIYRVLKKLIREPKKLEQIGRESREFILNNRRLKMTGEALHKLYQSLY